MDQGSQNGTVVNGKQILQVSVYLLIKYLHILLKNWTEIFYPSGHSYHSDYTLSFESSSEYLADNGRVVELPDYPECVTYTVTYTKGNETKTVTLSSMLPGLEG